MCMLLITYQNEALSFIPQTQNDAFIRMGFSALRSWEHLSLVQRGLARTRLQMRRAQIPVDDYVSPI